VGGKQKGRRGDKVLNEEGTTVEYGAGAYDSETVQTSLDGMANGNVGVNQSKAPTEPVGFQPTGSKNRKEGFKATAQVRV